MFDKKQYDLEIDRVRIEQINNISEHLSKYIQKNAEMRNLPVNTNADEDSIKRISEIPISRTGRDSGAVADELVNGVFKYSMNLQHPRFISMVPSAVSPYSLAGSILTDIYNPNACGYNNSPCVSIIEEKLVSWMCSLAGFEENKCGGLFTSGGSLSNLTAMIAAREKKFPEREGIVNAVAFASDQAHSSIVKGMRLMGLRNDQIRILPSDDDFRLSPEVLECAVLEEQARGKVPFLVVASMGTTNTGSIDPLDGIADVAKQYGMWVHVDGAFGGSILLSEIYRSYAEGIERADSLSWDLHKWAMQIYSCSCVLVKDKQTLISAYAEHPEYLEDVRASEHNDGWDLGIEMSRPARFIKWWYTVQAMGTDALADVVDYSFYNAFTAKGEFEKLPNWEICSKPMCGAVTVRYVPCGMTQDEINAFNYEVSEKIIRDGYAYVVTTTIKGKRVLRLCFINCNTTTEDVIGIVNKMNEIAVGLDSERNK